MARITYASRETAPPEDQALFDELEASRGKPVENIFLAIASAPDLCRGVLAMAMSLRRSQLLDRQLRELAVLTVGLCTGAQYEVEQHWNSAVKAGVPAAKLDRLETFETDAAFTQTDRIVMRYARDVTRAGVVGNEAWDALCGILNEGERLELVLTVAWYNAVARIILPLELDLESWHERLVAV